MATIRPSQYPGRWNPVSADAPQGSGKNRTAPGSNDGSYFDQVWFNDMDSLHQALFIASGVSPNGVQDIGTASQIFDALINNRWSAIGNYYPGTIVTGSDNNQYFCKSQNGRDTSVVDPSSVSDRNTWVMFPYEEGSNANGSYRIYFDDTIEQWGETGSTDINGFVTVTMPIPMNDTNYTVTLTDRTLSSSPTNNISIFGFVIDTPSTTTFQARATRLDGSIPDSDSATFRVIG